MQSERLAVTQTMEGTGDPCRHLNVVKSQTFESTERRIVGNTYNLVEIVTRTFTICPSPNSLTVPVLGNEENGTDKEGKKKVSDFEARYGDENYALAEDAVCKKVKEEYSSLSHFDTNHAMEERTVSASASNKFRKHKHHGYGKVTECVCSNQIEESSKAFGGSDVKSFALGEEGKSKSEVRRTSSTDAFTGVQDSSSRVTNGVGQSERPSRRPRWRLFLRSVFFSCLGCNVKN
ncbi:hypothetical protein Aperf_G00000121081 [Anoplocephala perfoliata]